MTLQYHCTATMERWVPDTQEWIKRTWAGTIAAEDGPGHLIQVATDAEAIVLEQFPGARNVNVQIRSRLADVPEPD